ncbi:sporozoite surface protein 2-like isoform X2 [Diachasmimorpha longicaudata]|uniref:sporozoite surface protein 2-like isoform X2 n=1 Tax=Diachasmimorpha longicaudata TaxID=58733 RepID=UPI0030B8EAE2
MLPFILLFSLTWLNCTIVSAKQSCPPGSVESLWTCAAPGTTQDLCQSCVRVFNPGCMCMSGRVLDKAGQNCIAAPQCQGSPSGGVQPNGVEQAIPQSQMNFCPADNLKAKPSGTSSGSPSVGDDSSRKESTRNPESSPSGNDKGNGVPSSPNDRDNGVPPSPNEKGNGVPPSPNEKGNGVPPSPNEKVNGVPPSPNEKVNGVPPSPNEKGNGVPPSPNEKVNGVPPSPNDKENGVPPSPNGGKNETHFPAMGTSNRVNLPEDSSSSEDSSNSNSNDGTDSSAVGVKLDSNESREDTRRENSSGPTATSNTSPPNPDVSNTNFPDGSQNRDTDNAPEPGSGTNESQDNVRRKKPLDDYNNSNKESIGSSTSNEDREEEYVYYSWEETEEPEHDDTPPNGAPVPPSGPGLLPSQDPEWGDDSSSPSDERHVFVDDPAFDYDVDIDIGDLGSETVDVSPPSNDRSPNCSILKDGSVDCDTLDQKAQELKRKLSEGCKGLPIHVLDVLTPDAEQKLVKLLSGCNKSPIK